MIVLLMFIGLLAGFLSGSVGFGGGMILLPVITWCYGVEVAVPVSTVAQLLSNVSRAGLVHKEIQWKPVFAFLVLAIPLTVLGSYGFSLVNKVIATRVLCICLIIFAVLKLRGKLKLPNSPVTTLVGGGLTGFVNGLLGISGPLSSAVFFSLGLAPTAYVGSEATAAAAMHIVKAIVYHKCDLLSWESALNGLMIGAAMMLGNYLAIKVIKDIDKNFYKRLVASVMIFASVFLFFTVK